MASDAAAAAFNGAGALILHLLQPFYRSGYGLACRERERERVRSLVLFCALWNFLHNFHIKKHGPNCYDYIS